MKQTYDPQVQDIVDGMRRARRPAFWQLTPAQARAQYEKGAPVLDIPARAVHAVEDRRMRVAGGGIRLRLYWPRVADPGRPLPALLWMHGGGFTVGSVSSYDALCRQFCAAAQCLVVSVDYRLAPEYRFPTAVDDCFGALQWLGREAASLGVDRQRVAVAGDSAGGTLAAVLALLARDAGLPLAGQLLVYPGTSARQDSASHARFADDPVLDRKTVQWFFSQYLRNDQDRDDWRFAPLLAPRLSGVAPAWIALAECDPLVDEGLAYAQRLEAEGVAVRVQLYRGMIHHFFNMGRYVDAARRAHEDFAGALRALLA
jgi:acetyl esterase